MYFSIKQPLSRNINLAKFSKNVRIYGFRGDSENHENYIYGLGNFWGTLGQSNFKVYTIYWCENISRVAHRPNFQMKIASLPDEGSNESSVFRAFDRAVEFYFTRRKIGARVTLYTLKLLRVFSVDFQG